MSKTIEIKGGLGNQLFQYAYGRKLQIIDKKDVVFNTYFFENMGNNTPRIFLLSRFNISDQAVFRSIPKKPYSKYVEKIALRLIKDYSFYQSEKYFKDIKDIILKEFTLKDTLSPEAENIKKQIQQIDQSVFIHIRRGDYVTNQNTIKHHGICDIEYYKKSIEMIQEKIQHPSFLIFSDDIEWVKENLKVENALYVSNPNIYDYEELYLMSLCSNAIIANSTFSWWGAYLQKNKNKIIIAPEQWTIKKTSKQLDIIPENWICH